MVVELVSWSLTSLFSTNMAISEKSMVVDIPDVITSANFGEDRLRGSGVEGGQSLPFSIDFDRRPYNNLALPCECVITYFDAVLHQLPRDCLAKCS